MLHFRSWLVAESAQESGFLRNIYANWEDGMVKGVYADWLDEQGRQYEASVWRAMGLKEYFFWREARGTSWPVILRNGQADIPKAATHFSEFTDIPFAARVTVSTSGTHPIDQARRSVIDGINIDSHELAAKDGPTFRNRVLDLVIALNNGNGYRPALAEIVNNYPKAFDLRTKRSPNFKDNVSRGVVKLDFEHDYHARMIEGIVKRYVGKRIVLRPKGPKAPPPNP